MPFACNNNFHHLNFSVGEQALAHFNISKEMTRDMNRKAKKANPSNRELSVVSLNGTRKEKREEERSAGSKRNEKGEMAFRRKRWGNKRRWVNKKDNFPNVRSI